MNKYFQEYYWDNGRPRGVKSVPASEEKTFKIVVDPYYKRYTVEQYRQGKFAGIVYDSAQYDFRWLKPQEQAAWHKEVVSESEGQVTCIIRNQDDRVIASESYTFEEGLCRSCEMYYPGGMLLATQMISYTKFGAPENKVVLLDRLSHPVVIKKYEADDITGDFTDLIEEVWNTKELVL